MHDLKKAAACFYGDVKTMKQYKFASKINVLQKIANATMCYVPETLFVGSSVPVVSRPASLTYRSSSSWFTATTANLFESSPPGGARATRAELRHHLQGAVSPSRAAL
jgi:hypothetical protein